MKVLNSLSNWASGLRTGISGVASLASAWA